PFGVFAGHLVPQDAVDHVAVLPDGTRVAIEPPQKTGEPPRYAERELPRSAGPTRTVPLPLGTLVGARSGDKGGDANIGVWARGDAAFAWLLAELTVDRLKALLPETGALEVERFALPNLRAVNFLVHGILGQGVAASTRFDPQGKALGEW